MTAPEPNALRDQDFAALDDRTFDLLVIGGGVTGCGIARDAALRGLKVALVEKEDFAAGTSSRSSKLVHGGLRYLEQAELKLVFEGTNERATLLKLAPHLVKPLPFLMPAFKKVTRWVLTLDIGLWIYDALCGFKVFKLHKAHRAPKIKELEPGLRSQGLTGGVVYYDCITDDARLTLENAIDARTLGAVILNHVKATRLLKDDKGQVCGAAVEGTEPEGSAPKAEVRAKVVVNATGPWSDAVRGLSGEPPILKPTKGVHLVLDAKRLPITHAIVMLAPRDSRVMFSIPWGDRTVIGTTDTFYEGDPDHVFATGDDADYLLEAANHYFPDAKLTRADVISTWAGLRPLVAPDKSVSASAVSREHLLIDSPGFITIAGGKLTTYRRIAAEVVDSVGRQLGGLAPTTTGTRSLPGSEGVKGLPELDALVVELKSQGLEAAVSQHLVDTYGVYAREVAKRALVDASSAARIDAEQPHLMIEVDVAMEREFARTLSDVLARRIPLLLRARDLGLAAAPRVAARMAARLGWSEARVQRELASYRLLVDEALRFRTV